MSHCVTRHLTRPLNVHGRSRFTTSPSRIFTVPDDCSTDENEPMEEDIQTFTVDSAVEPSSSTLGTADAKKDSHTKPSKMPQLDGSVDTNMDVTVGEAPELVSPEMTATYTICDDDESIRLTESSYSTSGYSSPSSPESPARHPSTRDLLETPFMTLDEDDSGSEFWVNNSVDEVDEDSNSHSSYEEDSTHEGVFVSDSDGSEDLNCEPNLMEALGPEELPELSEAPDTPSRHHISLPSIHHFIPWASGFPIREPSPSDAVFPFAPRRPEEDSEAPTLDLLGQTNNMGPATVDNHTLQGEVSVHHLGQISGKPDYFQAREHNKMALTNKTKAPRLNLRCERKDVARDEPLEPAKHHRNDGTTVLTLYSSSTPALSSIPRDPGLSWPTPLITQPSQHRDSPGLTATVDASDFAESDPASAWDLQQFKKNQTCRRDTRSDVEYSSPASITGAVQAMSAAGQTVQLGSDSAFPHMEAMSSASERQQDNESLWGSSDSALPTDQDDHNPTEPLVMQTSTKGKRKADAISSLTEEELNQYSHAELDSRAAEAHAYLLHMAAEGGPDDFFQSGSHIFPTPLPIETNPAADSAHSTLPSPPVTPDGQTDRSPRPNKRMKRIAERVGFAALGGATVGALVLSSLIYTAPDFV